MRHVQVMVPAGKREAVIDVLEEEGIDYVLTDETSGREYTAIVSFPLPTNAVEPVLDDLREAGIERDAYTVVLDAETVISDRFEELSERYANRRESDDRIAREEMVVSARELAPRWGPFLVLTAISAVVATAGLLLDSPAVVVGSMVIAPLIGPAMATSVGTVLVDPDLFDRGVRLQVIGVLLAIASAATFALALRMTHAVPLPASDVFALEEVNERLYPDVLSLPIALGSGVAGALSLASGVSTALVGVMIAAALVPPMAVVGIGIAWGDPATVLGAGVLVVVNFLSVNLAALATLWYLGYRPNQWFRQDEARTAVFKRVGALVVGILLTSAMLGSVTYGSYQTTAFEEDAREEIEATVAAHDALYFLDMQVNYYSGFPFRSPEEVVVRFGYPAGETPPPMASELVERLDPLVDQQIVIGDPGPLTVEVQYVTLDRASTGPTGIGAGPSDEPSDDGSSGDSASAA